MNNNAPDLGHPLVQDLLLNPSRWRIWPAVAVLRWMQRGMPRDKQRLIYRSIPSLAFPASEISDIAVSTAYSELFHTGLGLAGPGSPLPTADVEHIVMNHRRNGALTMWLDGPSDRFLHAVEAAQAYYNAAFCMAIGDETRSLRLVCDLAGYAMPFAAYPGGQLATLTGQRVPTATGLAAVFLMPPTASGMRELFSAFTGLPAIVTEFAGDSIRVLRPARMGGRMRMALGTQCHSPAAAVEIDIDGGSEPENRNWARQSARRRSLHLLARSYIGTSPPVARIFLRLQPGNAPPAALDGQSALGGMAVLGRASSPVRLPLAA